MINFYLKTLCSAILHSLSQTKKKKKKKTSNDENFVAHLMPYLLKGLKSKCVDYKRANYLILSHLSNIFTFQSNVKDEILNVMSKVSRCDANEREIFLVIFRVSPMIWSKKIFWSCRFFSKIKIHIRCRTGSSIFSRFVHLEIFDDLVVLLNYHKWRRWSMNYKNYRRMFESIIFSALGSNNCWHTQSKKIIMTNIIQIWSIKLWITSNFIRQF